MPIIREYTPRVSPEVVPSFTGVQMDSSSAQFQAARSLQELGNTATQVAEQYRTRVLEPTAKNKAASAGIELQQYSKEISQGYVDSNGNRVAPADPLEYDKLWAKKVKELREQAHSSLDDDRAKALFDAEFSGEEGRTKIALDTVKIQKYDESIKFNTEQYLGNKADSFVNANSDFEKVLIQKEVNGTLDKIEMTYGSKERQKMQTRFSHETARGSIVKMIRLNPTDAILSLDKGEFDKDLPADEVQRWKTKAFEAQRTGNEGTTNVQLFTELRIAAASGQDVTSQVRAAVKAGQLKVSDVNTLLNESERNSPQLAKKNWYKSGNRYLEGALKVGIFNNGFEKTQLANAKEAWLNWSVAHPNATPEEAEQEAKNIVKEVSNIRQDELSLANLKPRFLVYSKTDPNTVDMAASYNETKKQHQDKKIDDYEFGRQMRQLRKWDDILEAQRQSSVQTNKKGK